MSNIDPTVLMNHTGELGVKVSIVYLIVFKVSYVQSSLSLQT